MSAIETYSPGSAVGAEPPMTVGAHGGSVRVHDRYLSDRALLEAAAALRALASTLLDVRSTFADDAAVDADRLGDLADDLSAWCRDRPAGSHHDTGGESDRSSAQHWLGLLQVYLRPALQPGRTGPVRSGRRFVGGRYRAAAITTSPLV